MLKRIRSYVDANYEDRMLVAEANQWPEDAVEYFGDGDECHMSFHFPLMPRLYLALHTADRLPIVDILEQTPEIPAGAQWATFLRNHDELTLEMVTDEERELLWHAYAPDRRARLNLGIRRRLAPLLGNDRRSNRTHVWAAAVAGRARRCLYYGDELGMGDNIFLADRDGVRTPMQWSNDRNAGFSDANPQSLYLPVIIDAEFHYETVNAEAQHANPNSLLWWVRNMLHLRRRHPVFGRGDFELLGPLNPHVLAFLRTHDDETILVVANLSRQAQYVELDLAAHAGAHPVELTGATEFPAIGELPYLLTLGPHAFFWFQLVWPDGSPSSTDAPIEMPERLDALVGSTHPLLDAVRDQLSQHHWFRRLGGGELTLRDAIPIGPSGGSIQWWIAVLDREGGPRMQASTYALPLGVADETEDPDASLIARVSRQGRGGVVFDASMDARFLIELLSSLESGEPVASQRGTLTLEGPGASDQPPAGPLLTASSNPVVAVGREETITVDLGDDRLLRMYQRIEPGPTPGVELRHHVSERATIDVVPPLTGWLSYRTDEEFTVALIERPGPIASTAEKLLRDQVSSFAEGHTSVLNTTMESAAALANTVAAVHQALAGYTEDPALAPQPLTTHGQRGLYQTLRTAIREAFESITRSEHALDPVPGLADVIARQAEIRAELDPLLSGSIHAALTRVHGDMRLEVFSWTGHHFTIHDFSGDRTLRPAQRRLKRSPLRDVAQLLRSIDYAAMGVAVRSGLAVDPLLACQEWSAAASTTLLDRYLELMSGSAVIPESPQDTELLLRVFQLARSVHELAWETQYRPDRIPVAVLGIQRLMGWSPPPK